MTDHVNFYENLHEAQMRLRSTVVMYDGLPYYVLAICNHKLDGIFRTYLLPLDRDKKLSIPDTGNFPPNAPELGTYLDTWMDKMPGAGVLRKNMDSKHFNKFRPFPLGMINYGINTFYLERQPQRNREQGLTRSMIFETPVLAAPPTPMQKTRTAGTNIDLHTAAFKACVSASHPSAQECLVALTDPTIDNNAAAFDRQFALVRGPIDMLFLAYKTDIIGVMPKNSFEHLRLGREFKHTKEVVVGLKLFDDIK